MKVLITGHKGFIGKNLVDYIAGNTNWSVQGWEWRDSSFPSVERYDWVIHLGAISSTTERDIDKVMTQNFDFSKNLLDQCLYHDVDFQYASSASVYGANTDFREHAPKDPKSAYAWSKYLFDRHVEELLEPESVPLVQGFRYFNVFGEQEEQKGNMASPVTKFFKQAREQNDITLFEHSNDYKRDFVWVQDVCRAHVEFIKNATVSGIWNVGTGKATSFADVATAIASKTGATISEIPIPSSLHGQYQTYTCADLTKFHKVLPTFQWTSAIDWIFTK